VSDQVVVPIPTGIYVGPSSGPGVSPATTVTGPDALGALSIVGTSLLYARQDHDHGVGQIPLMPTTPAVIAETFPRSLISAAGQTNVQGAGSLQLQAIWLPKGAVIGHLFSGLIGAIAGPLNWWMGLYDLSLNQLALTADQTTAPWANFATKSLAIATTAAGAASTFTTTYAGLHYFGLMINSSGSAGTYYGYTGNVHSSAIVPSLNGGSDFGQTTPPAFPHQAASIAGFEQAGQLYAAVAA
jgi:hypothetical protein